MIWLTRVSLVILIVYSTVGFLATLFGRLPLPNIPFILILVLGLRGEQLHALLWAGLGGLLLDMTLPGRGFYFLFFMVLFLLIQGMGIRFHGRIPSSGIVGVVFGSTLLLICIEALRTGIGWSPFLLFALGVQLSGVALLFGAYRLWLPKQKRTNIGGAYGSI